MKQHLFWILDVPAWVIILFVISSLLMIGKFGPKHNEISTYQIFMHDVEGLIEGSPVRLMGIHIGYVSQVNIVNDDVYVKFVMKERNVKIPYGSKATVEFSGLGGSKSLEIYPPKSKQVQMGKFLIAQPPKRIHDSFGLLNDMFEQMMDMTYKVSDFMRKVGVIKNQQTSTPNLKFADELIDSSNSWIDKFQGKSNNLGDKILRDKAKLNKVKKEVKNGTNYGNVEPVSD